MDKPKEPTLTVWQLQERQNYDLETKIAISLDRIREWYEYYQGEVYVAFSGGKDSTVLLHLVRSLYPEVPAVFCNTGLEYPEVVDFVHSYSNVKELKPKKSFYEIIRDYGWPVVSKRTAKYIHEAASCPSMYRLRRTGVKKDGTIAKMGVISKKWWYLVEQVKSGNIKISARCCHYMKKKPLHQYFKRTERYGIVGVTASESRDRFISWKMSGCNAYGVKEPQSRPLMAWREQDILQYLYTNKIPIASVYGEIVCNPDGTYTTTKLKRTGCMYCLFGIHHDKEPNRIQQMQTTHPKQWNYIVNVLGAKEVLKLIGVPYALEDYTPPGCTDEHGTEPEQIVEVQLTVPVTRG